MTDYLCLCLATAAGIVVGFLAGSWAAAYGAYCVYLDQCRDIEKLKAAIRARGQS